MFYGDFVFVLSTAGREMSELRHVINELRGFDSLVSDDIIQIYKKLRVHKFSF